MAPSCGSTQHGRRVRGFEQRSFVALVQLVSVSYQGSEQVNHHLVLVHRMDCTGLPRYPLVHRSSRYFIWCSHGIVMLLNPMECGVVTRRVINITASLLQRFILLFHLSV